MRFGTDEQKSFFLPGILAGEINFAIGYTEPEAGTDLASLRTRAVRDGDEYVVNGAKIFTSGADKADYVWLAVPHRPRRPQAQGHLDPLRPTDSPGFSWSPIVTVAGATTTATYYADVRVPVANRVGERERGLADDHHPAQPRAGRPGRVERLRLGSCATRSSPGRRRPPTADGAAVLDRRWVQSDLARCRAELEAMYLLNWRMATAVAAETLSPADSSAVKVFGVERTIEIYRRLLGIVGAGRLPRPGLTRRGAGRPARADRPARPDQHLRRRGQRGPARDRGHGRPGHDPGGPVSAVARRRRRRTDARRFLDRAAGLRGHAPSGRRPRPATTVNQAMIRHWVEAMGDENPVYIDDEAARANGFPGVIAPPTMLQAWIMRGYKATAELAEARAAGRPAEASAQPTSSCTLLDEAGFTSVVATNCDQEYLRPLVLGDRLSGDLGHRVGLAREAHRPRRRPLRHHPPRVHRPARRAGGHHAVPDPQVPARARARHRAASTPPAALRPRPALTQDNAFFFDGARQGELLIQRCASCGDAAPPAAPGLRGRAGRSSGTRVDLERARDRLQLRGRPPPPGRRLRLPAAHRRGRARGGHPAGGRPRSASTPTTSRIGMPVVVEFVAVDDELTLPMFRPAPADGADRRRAERLMDFTFTEEQQAVAEAADGVFDGMADHRPGGGDRAHRRPVRRRAVGGAGQGRTSSAWPSPRSTADRASA